MDRISLFPLPNGAPEPARHQISQQVREALGMLAGALNHALGEEQLRITAFALRDLPPGLIVRACVKLVETEEFWPKPVQIRAVADALKREDEAKEAKSRLLPMPTRRDDDEPTFHCPYCRDEPMAWVIQWCPGGGHLYNGSQPQWEKDHQMTQCGRSIAHGPHTFASRCPCGPTNPVIAAHKKRIYGQVNRKSAPEE